MLLSRNNAELMEEMDALRCNVTTLQQQLAQRDEQIASADSKLSKAHEVLCLLDY